MIDFSTVATIMIIPLLVGVLETNSFQSTFCNIQYLNSTLECDSLRDTISLTNGTGITMTLNATTDTLNIDSSALRIIEVQNDLWNFEVESEKVYFVSDGSIFINVTSSYP